VEDRPRALDDSYIVDEGTTLVVSAAEGVLANDHDPEGDEMQAELVSSTSHGSLTFNNDGSFQYTPELGFNRSDSFDYRAKDAGGAGAPARVTIAVHSAHPFHNSQAPMDVNDDGTVNAQDVLMIINDINANGIRELPAERIEGTVAPMPDVNRDNRVTPIDILIIINYLNELAAAEGEGEAAPLVKELVPGRRVNTSGQEVPSHQMTVPRPLETTMEPSVTAWQQGVDLTLLEWQQRSRREHDDLTGDEMVDEELISLLCERGK
jgi:VCBS repeat-containing protein